MQRERDWTVSLDIWYNRAMNPERKKRLRSVKVIVSEALMVVAVIIMVVVLAFLVSGYWINSEGEVSQQGLLQLSSVPTGATVELDGSELPWIERTNMSRNVASGQHTIVLTREGYDTWTKTVNVSEGLLYRIHYPRLFLAERTREPALDAANFSVATISPDHSYLILLNNTTEWSAVNLNNEDLKPVTIDVAELFMATAGQAAAGQAEAGQAETAGVEATEAAAPVPFNGEILDVSWDRDSSHALFEVKFGETVEWLLLDVKNPKNSVNISRQFGGSFSEIQILDNSSNNLLVVQNGNLHKIDLGAKAISSVLVENVEDFDHYNQNEVVFSAKRSGVPEGEPQHYVGYFQIGDAEIKELERTEQPALVTLSKFYEDKYIAVLVGGELTVHKKDNFDEVVKEFMLSFAPEELVVGHNGEFQTMRLGTRIATLDMESMTVNEWGVEGEGFDWIDNDMIYTTVDGKLVVYDYDGLNRREIASGVTARFPAAITDDRWLYYFSDGQLMREWLTPR